MLFAGSLYWIDPRDEETLFPEVEKALQDPDGLLAVGGDLSPRRLIAAYHQGIFPWYNEGQPILWWSPDPRAILYPQRIHISRSLRKTLRRRGYRTTLDTAFRRVIDSCAQIRQDQEGTWLTPAMIQAYCRLFDLGFAHSVEVWHEGALAGGLYGVALGQVFFGESMFSSRTDASKVALVHLARQLEQWGFGLIDCQVRSDHLRQLGVEEISRRRFIQLLNHYTAQPGPAAPWQFSTALEAIDARR